jgi:2-polyprenyl-6-methoxyphenol hydroxylase-like FAD-dependent oxidoreductase
VALEDGIVLAQQLSKAWLTSNLQPALEAYEQARAMRCLPLTVRSRGMGIVLQSALPPVVLARDTAITKFLDPGHFFDHTLFDAGPL